jgi:hypothetical protein
MPPGFTIANVLSLAILSQLIAPFVAIRSHGKQSFLFMCGNYGDQIEMVLSYLLWVHVLDESYIMGS